MTYRKRVKTLIITWLLAVGVALGMEALNLGAPWSIALITATLGFYQSERYYEDAAEFLARLVAGGQLGTRPEKHQGRN